MWYGGGYATWRLAVSDIIGHKGRTSDLLCRKCIKYPLLLYPYSVTDCLYLEEIKAISVAILKILNLGSYRNRNISHINLLQIYRLFTVLYFSVRSSRSSALCHGLPSCMSVNRPPAGTSENQDTRDGKTRYNRGL